MIMMALVKREYQLIHENFGLRVSMCFLKMLMLQALAFLKRGHVIFYFSNKNPPKIKQRKNVDNRLIVDTKTNRNSAKNKSVDKNQNRTDHKRVRDRLEFYFLLAISSAYN